jgi:heavy metal-binding protein
VTPDGYNINLVKTPSVIGIVALVAVLGAAGGAVSQAQAPKPAAAAQDSSLPPLSYVCIMTGDEDVIEDHPGKCRKCGMTLVPIRLDSVWTCPVHAAIHEAKPGKCPIDGRPLIQMTMAVSWACAGSDKESTSPGTCADGTPMAKKFAPRPHGNHNPQHGGQFFMASDNWHHLEGTYLPSGVFRLHLYDDYTKPLPLAQVRAIAASVVVKDPKSGGEKTVALTRSGQYLQGVVGKIAFPASMYAKVKFKADGPDNRFDFTFDAYSKEPPAGAAPRTTSAVPAAPSATPAAPAVPAPTGAAAPAPSSPAPDLSAGVDPALVPLPIPETVPEMLAQLRQRTDQIRSFIDKGSFASIYVPAFQAKDLALALDAQKSTLSVEKRKVAEPAIAKLVRVAYMLDAFGDLGNKQQITEAYSKFVEAEKNIQSSFPAQP